MTNLALAFERAPELVPRVARIVAMGGGRFEGGNITPVAEFNIFADPHAAQAVLHAGRPGGAAPARRHAPRGDERRANRGVPGVRRPASEPRSPRC